MSRPNPTSPVKRGASVKSGFNPGKSKSAKVNFSAADTGVGHLGPPDPLAGFAPHPMPYPGAHPAPPAAPHPVPAPGGRSPAPQYQYQGPMDPGAQYTPPGNAQRTLLLLARALSPDTF